MADTASQGGGRVSGQRRGDVVAGLRNGVLLGLAVAVLALPVGKPLKASVAPIAALQPPAMAQAEFGTAAVSPDARRIADWVAASRDNHGLPFAILDKRGARAYVFDAGARLVGSSLVLLGSAVGDESVAGIGERRLADVLPEERTTAAGRFQSEPGHDENGEAVVWVDYEAALAMHRVKVIDPREHRLERIATGAIDDKFITNGCINVPIEFFDTVVEPRLGHSAAIVYVLPQAKSLEQVFPDAFAAAGR